MRSYLIETYVPGGREDSARAAGRRVRVEADALARSGTPARYVRTTIVPEDETCFHAVEAVSREVAEELCRRAGLGRARITATVEASRPTRRPGR